jgi:hypothetical protein
VNNHPKRPYPIPFGRLSTSSLFCSFNLQKPNCHLQSLFFTPHPTATPSLSPFIMRFPQPKDGEGNLDVRPKDNRHPDRKALARAWGCSCVYVLFRFFFFVLLPLSLSSISKLELDSFGLLESSSS